MRLIGRDALSISPWRNGAGRKADILTGPGWLIGFAFLDADAPFSDYAGHDRTITLVDGPGFSLSGPGRDALVVDTPLVPSRFDGGWLAGCTISGPCVVLNAMTARASWRHTVEVVTPAGEVFDPGAAVADVLVVARGTLTVDGMTARHYDALVLDAPAAPHASDDALVCRLRVLPA